VSRLLHLLVLMPASRSLLLLPLLPLFPCAPAACKAAGPALVELPGAPHKGI
jgi:hypothetical protein